MQLTLLLTAIVASVPFVHADCPSQRMEDHVIKQAMNYEAVKRNSLDARDISNITVGIYLHNLATGNTYQEAYVSVSLFV
jgi:hypothetical protein